METRALYHFLDFFVRPASVGEGAVVCVHVCVTRMCVYVCVCAVCVLGEEVRSVRVLVQVRLALVRWVELVVVARACVCVRACVWVWFCTCVCMVMCVGWGGGITGPRQAPGRFS